MKTDNLSGEPQTFTKEINIRAPVTLVWHVLTTPERMKQWLMPDIALEIITDWIVGSPIVMRGHMNGKDFENRGTVIQFEPQKALQYTHLSSISHLPERPESYTLLAFHLHPIEDQTRLTLTLSNFPTEAIYKHLTYYWNITLEVIKQMIEDGRLND